MEVWFKIGFWRFSMRKIVLSLASLLLLMVCATPTQAQLVTATGEYRVTNVDRDSQRFGVALTEAQPDKRQNWVYVKATTKFVKRTALGNNTFKEEVLSYDGFFNTLKKGDIVRVKGGRGWDGSITAKGVYF